MNARGHYGNSDARHRASFGSRPHVGGPLWHTIGDRENALAALKRDMDAVYQTLTRQILHATPEHPYGLASDTTINPVWFSWWQKRGAPFFNDFRKWAAERSPENWTNFGSYIAFGEQFTTDWDNYVRWRDQLIGLRKEAEKLGVTFDIAAPTSLPTTIVEDVIDVTKEAGKKVVGAGEDVWKLAKYAIYGALGIGAVIALSSVAQNLRSGTDPAEKYMDLLGKRRAREALPTARALPRGRPALELEEGDG